MKHISATMFVDDFVTGRVPDVCAVSGQPTRDRVSTSTEIDGPSLGWLLLLLFPFLGWLILAVVLAFSRRTYLRGALPITEEAYRQRRRRRRTWYAVLAGGVALLFVALFLLRDIAQLGGAGLIVALVTLAVAGAGLFRGRIGTPRIALDGSRRWVTVYQVHPAFAAAVRSQNERNPVG